MQEDSHAIVGQDEGVEKMEVQLVEQVPVDVCPIEWLPPELIMYIAEVSTWGEEPGNWRFPASYARHHAKLARVNRRFNAILERTLYMRNKIHDDPVASCVRWAAENGIIQTVIKAHNFGFTMDQQNRSDNGAMEVSPLHAAIFTGRSNIVRYLLAFGANVHTPSSPSLCLGCMPSAKSASQMPLTPQTPVYPLHTALVHGSPQDVEMLVSHGATQVAKNISAIPGLAFHGHKHLVQRLLEQSDPVSLSGQVLFAAASNQLDLLHHILKKPGASLITASNWMMQNALHQAATSSGDASQLVQFLMDHPDIDVQLRDRDGYTPLHEAIKHRNLPIVRQLLQHPSITGMEESYGRENVLHLAAATGDIELFKFLMKHTGADFEAADVWGRSVLRMACDNKESDDTVSMVQYLIGIDAPLYHDAEPRTGDALVHCILMKNLRSAMILVESGVGTTAQVLNNAVSYEKDYTLLQEFLREPCPGQAEVLKVLLGFGIDVNKISTESGGPTSQYELRYDDSPLLFAAAGARSTECMKLLIEAGALATTYNEVSVLTRYCFLLWGRQQVTDSIVALEEERLAMIIQQDRYVGHLYRIPTALSYACQLAYTGTSALLRAILKYARPASIHRDHMYHLINFYWGFEGPNCHTGQSVVSMLCDARERLFQTIPVSNLNERYGTDRSRLCVLNGS